MARSIDKAQTLNEIKRFIKSVTSYEEADENFSLCLNFATSNLKYHRFLDVDSHKVTRTFQGVVEKLKIHSETKKFVKLTELCETFLNTPGFEKKSVGKTDTHYAILQFLLLISDNPLKHEYIEQIRAKTPEEVDTFDWGAYLREGIEVYHPGEDSDDSDWTDEDDTLEDQDIRVTNPDQSSQSTGIPYDGQVILREQISGSNQDQREESLSKEAVDWLTRNLVAQYWKGEPISIELGKYKASTFNQEWSSYEERMDPLNVGRQKLLVTENIILREVVWMLQGVTKLHLFVYTGHRFEPCPGLAIPHLSEESLNHILASYTKYGSCVQILKRFVSASQADSSHSFCQTYQAFAAMVAEFLQSTLSDLVVLEQKLIKQEETITLLSLPTHLPSRLLQQVGVMYLVFMKGIHAGRAFEHHSKKASLLLTTLYNTLMEYDTLFETSGCGELLEGVSEGFNSADMVKLLLPIWIQTCRPYINIIDSWISQGHLRDSFSEFIIQRNKDVQTLDETFWEKSFFVTMDNQSNEMKSDMEEVKQKPADKISDWAPKFLHPVLQKIVLTGKSMEMLQGLGILAEDAEKTDVKAIEFKEGQLYDKYLTSLRQLLHSSGNPSTSSESTTSQGQTTPPSPWFTEEMNQQLHERGVYDGNLQKHFEKLMQMSGESHAILNDNFVKTMSEVDVETLCPIELILQQCLYPHIMQQYELVCKKLVNVLKSDYNLLDHMAAMRKFFLMEAGDSMFIFYTELFDKIRRHDPWKDQTSLTMALQDAIENRHGDKSLRLSVEVVSCEGQKNSAEPINITNCLKLRYEIPVPVDVVVNERCQELYNQIFSFLLQVKRAKYCLDELRFYDLSKESVIPEPDPLLSVNSGDSVPRKARIHRMHLLRMRLLSFANGLHTYIMTRILHSTGLEFIRELETAQDLDEVIIIHSSYVRKIHIRCLQHKQNAFLKDAILNVLNLALRFQRDWDKGIDQIKLEQIANTEAEFSRYILFLSSFLNSVTQRGSFPYLESLAMSLENLFPDR